MTYEELLRKKEKAIKRRKIRRAIRKGLLVLSLIVAMVLFILASFQLSITNPYGMVTMFLTGVYILAFWWVNDDVE